MTQLVSFANNTVEHEKQRQGKGANMNPLEISFKPLNYFNIDTSFLLNKESSAA